VAELALYEVQHRNFTTTVKLSEEEAEEYGDRAKRIGDVKPAERQPITQPSYATTDSEVESEATPPQSESKKAPARRNKARSADSDKA
jgi:hypothetical protein